VKRNLKLNERLQKDVKWHSDGDDKVKKFPQWSTTWTTVKPIISHHNSVTYLQIITTTYTRV